MRPLRPIGHSSGHSTSAVPKGPQLAASWESTGNISSWCSCNPKHLALEEKTHGSEWGFTSSYNRKNPTNFTPRKHRNSFPFLSYFKYTWQLCSMFSRGTKNVWDIKEWEAAQRYISTWRGEALGNSRVTHPIRETICSTICLLNVMITNSFCRKENISQSDIKDRTMQYIPTQLISTAHLLPRCLDFSCKFC